MIGELTNHLWQSTAFALVAGLLAVALRKNRAQVRYGLWLSASLKLLLPFSLLIGLGSRLEWAPADNSFAAQIATSSISYAMEQITQPFPDVWSAAWSAPKTESWNIADRVPLILFGVWACGFGAIALVRLQAWRRIRAAVRASSSLEIQRVGIQTRVQLRSCPGLLEPGVVGIWRPILLLPAGILKRLEPRQLEAVLAHELCHVRRRDNLTATLHMIVEAVFWFHPLVWWIGSRLVEERERACDEEVLRLGNEPQVYAEGILNVCRLYEEAPLICMTGVTGSNLKKRVEEIMRNRVADRLNFSRALLLLVVGIMALAGPIAAGIVHATVRRAESPAAAQLSFPSTMDREPATIQTALKAQQNSRDLQQQQPETPKVFIAGSMATQAPVVGQRGESAAAPPQTKRLEFEVASIRLPSGDVPNPGARFGCRGVDGVLSQDSAMPAAGIPEGRCVGEVAFEQLVALAYNVPRRYVSHVSGRPEWIRTPFQLIQINAKVADPATSVSVEQLREMLRSLLADRFKLEFHREKQQAPEYLLRVARDGPEFKPAAGPEEPPRIVPSGPGQPAITIRGKSDMGAFVRFLTNIVGFPVIDATGISGVHEYSLRLNVVPGQRGGGVGVRGAGGGGGNSSVSVTEFEPPISVALQEQLGLRLDRDEVTVEAMIIDHAEQPSEN